MKKIILTTVIAFSALVGFAQGFSKDDGTLNFQIYGGSAGTYYTTLPGLMVSYDIGVHDLISVAPYAYFQHSSYKYTYWNGAVDKNTSNNFGFGARGLFHYGNLIKGIKTDQLDLYGGLALGLDVATYKWKYDSDYYRANGLAIPKSSSSASGLGWDVFAGARWYFSDAFAVNAEVSAWSWWKIGVTFKF